ncbi:hypothetical protein Areg01_29530 [Actinoplanes regularis]|nr:hypothetical protein Areg01_29530 [Actinoplanes regularis]
MSPDRAAEAVLQRLKEGVPTAFDITREADRSHAGPPPDDLTATVRWITANTVKLNDLQDAALVRKALDTLSLRTTDGKPAAANTIARKRAVFYGALRYAVELRGRHWCRGSWRSLLASTSLACGPPRQYACAIQTATCPTMTDGESCDSPDRACTWGKAGATMRPRPRKIAN